MVGKRVDVEVLGFCLGLTHHWVDMEEFKMQNEIVGVGKMSQTINKLHVPGIVELQCSRFPVGT